MPLPAAAAAASSASLSFFSSSSLFLPCPNHSPISKLPLLCRHQSRSILLVRSELAAATLPVLSFTGDQTSTATLSLKSAPPPTARAVVHRGLVADRRNARSGTASTLTRAEVSGGGKKPYGQKKTGKARRGSQRTPLRPGGGVIFGPKPKDWSIKINRKEKRLSISTAIASAAAGQDALVVEDFEEEFEQGPRTKDFIAAMKRWGLDPKEKATFLLTEVTDNVVLSCRNIGTLKLLTPRTLNLFDILDAEKLVFTKSAVDYLNAMYGEDAIDDFDEAEGDEEAEEELEEGGEEGEGEESS